MEWQPWTAGGVSRVPLDSFDSDLVFYTMKNYCKNCNCQPFVTEHPKRYTNYIFYPKRYNKEPHDFYMGVPTGGYTVS